MTIATIFESQPAKFRLQPVKASRIQSIDLMRGVVMIIMALDHVRDYFHYDAFIYQPTDLGQTSIVLFFTRWITHYCSTVFVFLAGISAYLYGKGKSRKQLSRYLFTRGLWLVFAELFLITLGWTFNPTYPIFNFQVIWAIGVSMIVLSAMIYMSSRLLLVTGIVLIAAHNLLDSVHIPGNVLWAMLHESQDFTFGRFHLSVHYPVVPWIGLMAVGYYFGRLYMPGYDPDKRRTILLSTGIGAIVLFVILRSGNFYGDAAYWAHQKNPVFTFLSFLNVTKYPPSLQYILITLGPGMVLLAALERPLNSFTRRVVIFGRVPFFYYVLHIYLIHLFALVGAFMLGYNFSDMILADRVNRVAGLKGYGFNLGVVYMVWICLVVLLYPCCKWFERYKRANQSSHRWLSYV